MKQQPTPAELAAHFGRMAEFRKVIDLLAGHVEMTYGMFMDSLRGWGELVKLLEHAVEDNVAQGKPREAVLAATLIHGDGKYEDGKFLHRSPIGERIAACRIGGANEGALSSLCLVSIYAFWEDNTRGAIARALSVKLDEVKSPLFGDIRVMRHSILHMGGVMDRRGANALQVLKWFREGQRIVLTQAHFHEMVVKLRDFPTGLHTPTYNPFPSITGAGEGK
jgi:hypothetical protein